MPRFIRWTWELSRSLAGPVIAPFGALTYLRSDTRQPFSGTMVSTAAVQYLMVLRGPILSPQYLLDDWGNSVSLIIYISTMAMLGALIHSMILVSSPFTVTSPVCDSFSILPAHSCRILPIVVRRTGAPRNRSGGR